MFMGGLLYLGGLRFLQFLAAIFRSFTNIGAVFRFCRLLRFAEIGLFLTRFSGLSYIFSGFLVFKKYAVCGYSLPYCGSGFTDIRFLVAARGLLVTSSLSRLALCVTEMQQTINGRGIYPFNKGLQMYGGCTTYGGCNTPLMTR